MSVWDPIAGLPDLVDRFQFAKVSSQILRNFWHIGCKADECLKGEKSLWKSGFCWAETEMENGPSRHNLSSCCQLWAHSAGNQRVLSLWLSNQHLSWVLKWRTHTSKTTQVEMHTQTKTFFWLACFISTFKLKKNCPSFCTIPTLSPHSFLLSCTTLSTKRCFYHHVTVGSSWS